MASTDSALDLGAVERVRALLDPPQQRDAMWPALAAAAALALTSVVFATMMVFAPPVQTEHVAKSAPG